MDVSKATPAFKKFEKQYSYGSRSSNKCSGPSSNNTSSDLLVHRFSQGSRAPAPRPQIITSTKKIIEANQNQVIVKKDPESKVYHIFGQGKPAEKRGKSIHSNG